MVQFRSLVSDFTTFRSTVRYIFYAHKQTHFEGQTATFRMCQKIRSWKCRSNPRYYVRNTSSMLRKAIRILLELTNERQNNNWISVTNKYWIRASDCYWICTSFI